MSGMKKGVIAVALLTAAALVVALIGAVRAGRCRSGCGASGNGCVSVPGVGTGYSCSGRAWRWRRTRRADSVGDEVLAQGRSRVREGCAGGRVAGGCGCVAASRAQRRTGGLWLAKCGRWCSTEKDRRVTFKSEEGAEAILPRFLAAYPDWVRRGDALHLGTHPPGLIASRGGVVQRLLKNSPTSTRFVLDHVPASVELAFRVYAAQGDLSHADKATLPDGNAHVDRLRGDVAPLYCFIWPGTLRGAGVRRLGAVAAGALGDSLSTDGRDTAFPVFCATALALAAKPGRAPPVICGVALGVGMQFTLAFLAVGLVVALFVDVRSMASWKERAVLILATGFGFLATTATVWVVTGADPFLRLVVESAKPRALLCAIPQELRGVGRRQSDRAGDRLGLARDGVGGDRPGGSSAPKPALAAVVVLVFLTISGKNLSEVARFWLPLMPALLVAAGRGFERLDADARRGCRDARLLGETLALQTMIQVVYPV